MKGRIDMRKKTNEEFLNELKEKNVHYNNNDIEILEEYKRTHDKILCHCNICNNDFYKTPHDLLEGKYCQKCSISATGKDKLKTHSQFLREIQEINPNIEILGEYKGSHIKIKYRCKVCDTISEQTPTVMLQGHGCQNCANKKISECRKLKQEEVERRFDEIKEYVKIIGDYKGVNKKIKCECTICGYQWETVPNVLWFMGCKCPQCSFSHGETKIKDYFINHSIYYKSQQKFDDLRGVHNGLLSYDFYLPDYNCLIEFQGEQHEKSIKYFGKEKFKSQIEHDKRKRDYAEANGYKLLEIWYYDYDRIEEILNKELEVV